ncbi:MAG TPA: ERF family protein [Ruminiclostridium sp.]
MNIYEKLAEVQSKLKVSKDNFNAFGKYKYRSCEDILEGVKPLLKEIKAVVILGDKVEQIGDRFYIKATATFFDIEKPSDICIVVDAYAREDLDKKGMDLAQVTGSVSSYARKYALNGLFCIDDTKDSDALNKHEDIPTTVSPIKTVNKPTITDSKPTAPTTFENKCHDCDHTITATTKRTVEEIIAGSLKYYKVKLCSKCSSKRFTDKQKPPEPPKNTDPLVCQVCDMPLSMCCCLPESF